MSIYISVVEKQKEDEIPLQVCTFSSISRDLRALRNVRVFLQNSLLTSSTDRRFTEAWTGWFHLLIYIFLESKILSIYLLSNERFHERFMEYWVFYVHSKCIWYRIFFDYNRTSWFGYIGKIDFLMKPLVEVL